MIQYYRDKFTCDGIKTAFSPTTYLFYPASSLVFLNGVFQDKGTFYTEGSDRKSIITASIQPDTWILEVAYLISAGVAATIAPTDFKGRMLDDVLNVFLNDSEFAEVVTVTPYGGTAKAIKGIVTRDRLQPDIQANNHVLTGQIELYIANDPIYGVAAINKGQDLVSLPERIGGSNISWRIIDILGQDEGMWRLLAMK